MPSNPISSVDPDGLLEFSVVFTDRSLNHMSAAFQAVMRDVSAPGFNASRKAQSATYSP